MPCFRPLTAWRSPSGIVSLREPSAAASETSQVVRLPCGRCIGCSVRQARDWAVRCCLEAAEHEETAFVTLTYDDENIPPDGALRKSDLSAWLKRVRESFRQREIVRRDGFWSRGFQGPFPSRRIRFFACGEYGENTHRPHYHVLLFGVPPDPSYHLQLQDAWSKGFIRVDPCTPASISYVAGYVGKKIGDPQFRPRTEEVFYHPDELRKPKSQRKVFRFFSEFELVGEDGDIVPWRGAYQGPYGPFPIAYKRCIRKVIDPSAPFRLMSRRPGIGANSRHLVRHWRTTAIWRGKQVPVPRYLHLAYKLSVSPEEYEVLEAEKRADMLQRDLSRDRLTAGEQIAVALRNIKAESRTL